MNRLRPQGGFTLIELLVAMMISTMTVLAVFTILETTMKQSSAVAGRVNATQRGRITMDTITRQLRSQVCYGPTVPALVSATDDAVKFHVDLTDGTKPIEQHELVFNPTAKTVSERVWPGTGSPVTFPTQTVNRQLAGDITRAQDKTAAILPFFKYYAYDTATVPRPTALLPTPLSTTDLARVAKIEINFRTLPPGKTVAAGSVSLQNEIYVRIADPNDPSTHSHMRLIPRLRTRLLAEHGFSMIIVMGVMAASSLFVAAAFAAANGDLPLTRDSQDRKQAYAAAEAGINYYQYHLNQDPDYWTRCTNVPAPNATENQPVNQKWNKVGADPRRWRKVAGTPTQYTIELMPATGYTSCIENNLSTMIDPATGTFKVAATGMPRAGSKLKRTLVANFRRRSFLDFLYFTDFETTDPINYSSSQQSWAQANCGDQYRADRDNSCLEIQFADADAIKGPLHTNDDILTCGTPEFGRNSADSIEFSGPAPGFAKVGGSCPAGDPKFNGPKRANVKALTMPPTNTTLQDVALSGGLVYQGKTTIRFNPSPANNMTVTNPNVAGGAPQTRALPTNGVIYVANKTGGCGSQPPPSNANYNEPSTCGNLYVSGTYTASMTLASANDIIIAPPTGQSNGDLIGSGNSVLGLVAQNFVRVYHRTDSNCDNVSPVMKNVRIDAAILSLDHSFTADNYDCGAKLENLTVNGAIAQKYRGAVGTTGGTGFIKDYNYDDRLRYRSPPYFLEPIAASWHVVRSNEQVPPR